MNPFIGQSGSHIRLEKYTADGTIKLTVPNHPELKKGHIIKTAGLTVMDLEK